MPVEAKDMILIGGVVAIGAVLMNASQQQQQQNDQRDNSLSAQAKGLIKDGYGAVKDGVSQIGKLIGGIF